MYQKKMRYTYHILLIRKDQYDTVQHKWIVNDGLKEKLHISKQRVAHNAIRKCTMQLEP